MKPDHALPSPSQVADQASRLAAQLLKSSADLRSAPWRVPAETLDEGEALLAAAIAAALALARAAQDS